MNESQKDRSGVLKKEISPIDSSAPDQAEAALKISEEQLKDAQRLAKIGSWRYIVSSGSLWWSDELYRMFSLRSEDGPVSMERFLHRVHPDDREQLKKQIESGLPYRSDYRILLPEGILKYVHEEVQIHCDNNAKPIVYSGTAQDVTERRNAEEKLQLAEKKYRSLVEMTDTGYVILDSRGHVLDANQKYASMTGRKNREDVIGHSVLEWTASYDQERNAAEVRKCIEQGYVRNLEIDYVTPSGQFISIEINATVLDAEESFSILSLCRDVTERKDAEIKLLNMMREQSIILDNANVSIWKMIDRKPVWVNKKTIDLLKYPVEELIGESSRKLYPSQEAYEQLGREAYPFLALGGAYVTEQKLIRRDGVEIWVRYNGKAIEPPDLSKGVIWILEDITDRKKAEEALRQSEQFIRSILDTVDEGFIVVDRNYLILTANKAYCSQVGGCDNTIIGRHCYEISHKTDRPCYEKGEECATRHAFETGTPHSALHRHKDSNGNILYVETKAFPIKDASGTVISVIETINNITEKYLLEEERLKSQKLESIGTLAGGIAHDFNNLLQGVFGYISMAKITHDQKEKSLSMLDQAEEALHLSVNLTTQLLTFSKGGKPVKKLIRLQPSIENAVKFALSGSHTDYRLQSTPELWSVEADAGQLAQVIQNIVLNANDAMAGRGTVTISLKNIDIAPKANPRLPEGGQYVSIDIQDTGTGISEQNISKIFDPYFTTKQKGSGLGLATSYSIIKNHGGVIEVKSDLGRGTTFTIYLPASGAAEAEVKKTAPSTESAKKGRILLMDDEDLVRNVAKEMIAAFGHEVEGAEDGSKAIELFSKAREEGRPFDLVILDLTVKGGMGGEEAIAIIRAIDPNVKAVVSSGYADSPVVADYRAYGFSAVLNKPYKIDALQKCLSLFMSEKIAPPPSDS